MKPSLKEVKAYFKNAKEVKSTLFGEVFEIDHTKEFSETEHGVYCYPIVGKANKEIYLKTKNLYAEIISYKDTFTITKEQIIEASNDGSKLKEWFPSVFEIELNRYYKWKGFRPTIGFVDRKTSLSDCYGFSHTIQGICKKEYDSLHKSKLELATPEEVETALVNEAKKRGFKDGVKIKQPFNNDNITNCLYEDSFTFDKNELWYGGSRIFSYGKWATILPQPIKMTVAEVEAKLGHAVEIVK
jgi:hypothetical protein